MRASVLILVGVTATIWTSCLRADAIKPTYHRDIEPLIQKHCQDCHRPGQVAPFSLLTFEQARKRASDLAAVTESRQMPPWHASTKVGGPFHGARVLSDEEIRRIADWVDAECPEGDPKDAPPAKTWSSDWPLGQPDLVMKMPNAYRLEASGRDELRVFVIATGLTEGRWIRAIDFKPGNTRVVHHILSAFDTTGRARELDAADPAPGYATFGGYGRLKNGLPFFPSGSLTGWAPGKNPFVYRDGVGRYIPAGADILLQVHYHKDGKPETDASSIGLYFAKKPVDKLVRGVLVTPPRPGLFSRPTLRIPAGDANHEVKGEWTSPVDMHLQAVVPHMHWLGKDFLLTAIYPDGTRRILIKVDQWDFNWQDSYDFESPLALPRGTRVEMVAHFDNSESNPNNPSKPPRLVTWGEQTTDEMCIGFLHYTLDAEHLGNAAPPAVNRLQRLRRATVRQFQERVRQPAGPPADEPGGQKKRDRSSQVSPAAARRRNRA